MKQGAQQGFKKGRVGWRHATSGCGGRIVMEPKIEFSPYIHPRRRRKRRLIMKASYRRGLLKHSKIDNRQRNKVKYLKYLPLLLLSSSHGNWMARFEGLMVESV